MEVKSQGLTSLAWTLETSSLSRLYRSKASCYPVPCSLGTKANAAAPQMEEEEDFWTETERGFLSRRAGTGGTSTATIPSNGRHNPT